MQKVNGKLKAEVTVFLSLLMLVLLGFVGALIQSSKYNMSKVYERNQTDMATKSVFAEYNQPLWEEFHVFALETTYESGDYDVNNLKERLEFYGANEVKWEITQLQQLSDCNGAALEEQIVLYMKEKYGITQLQYLLGETDSWESQREAGEKTTEQMTENEVELDQQLIEQEGALAEAGNPLPNLSQVRGSGILSLVIPDGIDLSNGKVDIGTMPSHRSLQNGINSYQLTTGADAMTKIMLVEYALEHFRDASSSQLENTDSIAYEVEYLLEGQASDVENLKRVLNKLVMMRMGANYTCLMQSPTKKAEVSAMALTIATASAMPVLQPIVEQALLLGWAYGESIMDLRSLLAGKSVSLLKKETDWQLGLAGLFTLGTEEDQQEGKSMKNGMSYKEYLRILLYMEGKDTLAIRQMDMIENRLRYVRKLSYFRIDYCSTQLQYMNCSKILGGLTYEYPVSFTYK